MATIWDETNEPIYNLVRPASAVSDPGAYYVEALWKARPPNVLWNEQFHRWRHHPYANGPVIMPAWSRFLPSEEAAHLAQALIFTTNGGCPDSFVAWEQNNDTGQIRIAVVQAVTTLPPTEPPEWAQQSIWFQPKPTPRLTMISRFDIINGDD